MLNKTLKARTHNDYQATPEMSAPPKWCYSALSRGLGEKRLVLGHNFGALALWTSSCFFLVLADGHREGETLVTLFATILVNRHRGVRSTWLTRLYPALRDVTGMPARFSSAVADLEPVCFSPCFCCTTR